MLVNEKKICQKRLDPDLLRLSQQLKATSAMKKKIALLKKNPRVKAFFITKNREEILASCSDEEKVVFCSLVALGQVEGGLSKSDKEGREGLFTLFEALVPIERFYKEIGGILGYHLTCLHLMEKKEKKEKKGNYSSPKAIDISEENLVTRQRILSGIAMLGEVGEMYPIGGAADRLGLRDEYTGNFQSAAPLEFCGKTLVERLICDLQAREYLHFKLFGRQVVTPVAMMTSFEKGNDADVKKIFANKQWFGRKEEDIFLFSQPLVPTMTAEGAWCLTGEKELLLKPGGHGVIWKLAKEKGVLQWFKERKKRKILLRQINNLASGLDYGLLAFMGVGLIEDREIGFASCPRREGMSEGINVIIENQGGLCLTNIEYCDVSHFQVDAEEGIQFFANTNILFVDVKSAEWLVNKNPFPGILINAKKMKYRNEEGVFVEKEVLRLESTMQNLADGLVEQCMFPAEMKKSYLTLNHRHKTISTIKKEFSFGSSILQTPEQCFIDLLENGRDLLVNYCQFEVPPVEYGLAFFTQGPSFIFLYHPALGPFYRIISQKLQRGKLHYGSVLHLEIAETLIEDLDLEGSLEVVAEAVLGDRNPEGVISYSSRAAKCILKNIRVQNLGLSLEHPRPFWKSPLVHLEKCSIVIEEGGEFYGEDLSIQGNFHVRVPKDTRVIAYQEQGEILFRSIPIQEGNRSLWKYHADKEAHIWVEVVKHSQYAHTP